MRAALALALVCLASQAAAESKVDALFKKAKQQLAEKRYTEACPAFERVDELDPGIGAKLNVGKCYEEWGKLAIAYKWYADALSHAKSMRDKRHDKIKDLVENLDADVPRLTIRLPANADPAAAAVQLDGKPFPVAELGKEQRVDPGPHAIAYVVSGKPRTKNLSIEKGASTEVELPFDAVKEEPPPPGGGGGSANAGKNWRKLAGIGSGALGVIGLGVSSVLTLTARSSYKDALADHCRGATDMCSPEGLRLTSDAKSRANTATVIAIVGAAAVAGGVVLYLTAPKRPLLGTERALYLAPSVDPSTASVILGGTF
jgi:tetratricopeptide (TPR) repeat protein